MNQTMTPATRTAMSPAQQQMNTIKTLLQQSQKAIASRLPKHLTPDRITKVAHTAINKTPKLLECSRESLLMSIMQAAELGGGGAWIHYAATKGAIDSLTRGLAKEVASEGIRVNAVAPGLIETDLHAAAGKPERLTEMAAALPAGRAGSPEEVADCVCWLASEAASYITGAIIPVAGGR